MELRNVRKFKLSKKTNDNPHVYFKKTSGTTVKCQSGLASFFCIPDARRSKLEASCSMLV